MSHLQRLIEGYRRFRESDWAHERERWAEMAEGQSPRVMILSCADSRVDPAHIFDARPGEMFVVRNIAALAPPYETSGGFHGVSAALEFAVAQLEVAEILVLGHGLCGGCAAALTGQFDGTPHGEGKVIDIHPLQDAVTVLIEEAFIVVQREELTPLDEWEALESKAKGGCSKHDSGGCDCGAHRGAKAPGDTEGDGADIEEEEADLDD